MAQARWATWQHACGMFALLSALAQQAHAAAVARPLTTAAARQTAHRLVPGADALHRCSVTDLLERHCVGAGFHQALVGWCSRNFVLCGRRRRPADKRRRASEVLHKSGRDLERFLYVYELPSELNVDRQALPTYWHDEQYDCELPPCCSHVSGEGMGYSCSRRSVAPCDSCVCLGTGARAAALFLGCQYASCCLALGNALQVSCFCCARDGKDAQQSAAAAHHVSTGFCARCAIAYTLHVYRMIACQ